MKGVRLYNELQRQLAMVVVTGCPSLFELGVPFLLVRFPLWGMEIFFIPYYHKDGRLWQYSWSRRSPDRGWIASIHSPQGCSKKMVTASCVRTIAAKRMADRRHLADQPAVRVGELHVATNGSSHGKSR